MKRLILVPPSVLRGFITGGLAGTLTTSSLLIVGCGGPQTPVTRATTPAPIDKQATAPAWVDGEMPSEAAFFGHGEAPIEGDVAAATTAAKANAMANLKLELGILATTIKDDHEEQVAEIISKYPMEKMNGHVDDAIESTVAAAEVMGEYTDDSRTPPVRHVLLKVSPERVFETLYENPELPDEQKNRLRDYQPTFVRNVLGNLGRSQ